MPAHAWQVKTAEEIGAHHRTNGMPREDAAAVVPATSWDRSVASVSVAVSDGHGHARHFRSERGSAIAVEVSTRLGSAFGKKLAGMTDATTVEKVLRAEVGPAVVGQWRDTVIAHIDENPVTDDEFAAAQLPRNASIDELIFGYGATLLVAVAAGKWLAFLQIGDGDLFVVGADGRVRHPLPIDPRLDGLRTTSLCQADALQSMRYAAVDTSDGKVGAVMMATDGYGNAQVRNDWEAAFGHDLAVLAETRGIKWIGDQLQSWVTQCASSDGSGDDVTAALLFATDAKWNVARDGDITATLSDTPAEATTQVISELPTTRQLPVPAPAGEATLPNRSAPPTPPTVPRAAAAARLPSAARHRKPDSEETVVDPPPTVRIQSVPVRSAPPASPGAQRSASRPAPTRPSASAAATTTSRNVAPAAAAAPASAPPAERTARSRRTLWLLLLLIVVVVGILVALLSVMWQGSSETPKAPGPSVSPTVVKPSVSSPVPPGSSPGRSNPSGGLGGAGNGSSTPPSTHN